MSVGIAKLQESGANDVQKILQEADAALYRAKKLGRNPVDTATPGKPEPTKTQAKKPH